MEEKGCRHTEILLHLGEGDFGKVFKVKKKKKLQLMQEIEVDFAKVEWNSVPKHFSKLKRPDHKNVVRYAGFKEKLLQEKIYVFTDFSDAQTLAQYLEAFKDNHSVWQWTDGREWRAWRLAKHIAAGLGHLHGLGVLHRRLKPDNVMAVQKRNDILWKVANFGLTKFLDGDSLERHYAEKKAQDGGYIAPEVISSSFSLSSHSPSSDVFSLGSILAFFCRVGRPPFADARDVLSRIGRPAKSLQDPIPKPRLSRKSSNLQWRRSVAAPEGSAIDSVGLVGYSGHPRRGWGSTFDISEETDSTPEPPVDYMDTMETPNASSTTSPAAFPAAPSVAPPAAPPVAPEPEAVPLPFELPQIYSDRMRRAVRETTRLEPERRPLPAAIGALADNEERKRRKSGRGGGLAETGSGGMEEWRSRAGSARESGEKGD